MGTNKLISLVVFLCCFLMQSFSFATEDQGEKPNRLCPEKISVPQKSKISQGIKRIIQNIYADLNCITRFRDTPQARQLVEFNNASVDGELFRIPVIESKYTRDFVRSGPLLNVELGLIGSPQADVEIVGYLKGVVWQEGFVNRVDLNKVKLFGFSSAQKMYESFKRQKITHFLGSKLGYFTHFKDDQDIPEIKIVQHLTSYSLHHYLAGEYAPFMDRFNSYIEQKNPFNSLQTLNNY